MATITTCDKCSRVLRDSEARYKITIVNEAGGPGEWAPVMREVCKPCVERIVEPYPTEQIKRDAC